MPSNNTGYIVKDLFKKYPDKIALMLNPYKLSDTQFKFKYAIDNGAFKRFDEKKFFNILDISKKHLEPMFIVCPDVVACHDRTLALWHYYYKRLKKYNYKIAFVVQDGCIPKKVPDEADWIFIGGSDEEKKLDSIKKYLCLDKPIHVGRVNNIKRVIAYEKMGITSCDGTGWMRGRDKKFYDLMTYLEGNIFKKYPLYKTLDKRSNILLY